METRIENQPFKNNRFPKERMITNIEDIKIVLQVKHTIKNLILSLDCCLVDVYPTSNIYMQEFLIQVFFEWRSIQLFNDNINQELTVSHNCVQIGNLGKAFDFIPTLSYESLKKKFCDIIFQTGKKS